MTEARAPVTDDALVEKVARAIQDLIPAWMAEDGTVNDEHLAIAAIAIAYPAGVAAGREEAPYPTLRVMAAKASVEATIHQINNHWWNKRIRPDARDLRVLLDFVAAAAIRQRGE